MLQFGLCSPRMFEGDEVICFAGIIATEDPRLVLLGKETRTVEDMQADVRGVLFHNRVS
jgi:hypothetical protein